MNQVAEITVPPCGRFSFPLPLPKGQPIPESVQVGGIRRLTRKITDRLILVEGHGEPHDVLPVSVGNGAMQSSIPNSLGWTQQIRVEGQTYDIGVGIGEASIVHNGVRVSIFCDFFQDVVVMTCEIANAEWKEEDNEGPLVVPKVQIQIGQQLKTMTVGNEGTMNPREHISRRAVYAIGLASGDADAMMEGEHRIHCRGAWSFSTLDAWGPQNLMLSGEQTPPIYELSIRQIGQGSPCRAMGFPDGNEVGGFLIEPAYRPGLDGFEAARLLEFADAMMEREALWTYYMGQPMDAWAASQAYGGTIPFRVEGTNVPHLMIPEYAEGNPHSWPPRPSKWKNGARARIQHGWKPHDDQHFVRVTALLKSAAWNTGDRYAIHCLRQVGAHAQLVRSHMPHHAPNWIGDHLDAGGTVFGMLNLHPDRDRNLGIGLGRREDAWMGEAVLMDYLVSDNPHALNWLRGYAEVIRRNILPTGVGVQLGNPIVEERGFGESQPAAVPAPGHQMPVRGTGITQVMEAEHFVHLLYCMGQIEEFSDLLQYVVEASHLIASAHVPLGDTGLFAPYWYINVANSDRTAVHQIFASSGFAHAPFENWYGMTLHGYAHLVDPEGGHMDYLKRMYGEDLDRLPEVSSANHEDRAQILHMAANFEGSQQPIDPGPGPDPDPDPGPDPRPGLDPRDEKIEQLELLNKKLAEGARMYQRKYQKLLQRVQNLLANLPE